MVHEKISYAYGAFFEVLAKRKGQKPILFRRIRSELVTRESSEDDPESLQFFNYELNAFV